MSHLGSFETPDRRLQRLRTEIGRTIEDMEKTVSQGVDLEARRRSSFESGMERFRQVEQRQQPPVSQIDFSQQLPQARSGQFTDSLFTPSGVRTNFGPQPRGAEAFFDPHTDTVSISPELGSGTRGTLAHEGGHALLERLPAGRVRARTLSALDRAFTVLSLEERNQFFAISQQVLGQVGESTIENRFGVGGPVELFADVVAVALARGPEAVPPSLLEIVGPSLRQQRQRQPDGMERFRQVEQRQQPRRPVDFARAPSEVVRGPEINFGASPLRPDIFAGQMAAQRAGDRTFGTSPEGELILPSETGLPVIEGLERFRTRFTAPIAATGLQIAESPIGSQIPGVSQLKDLGRLLEDVGVPEEVSPLPRSRTFGEAFELGVVNPIAAALGSEEEQQRAQAVLEEAGLSRSLAAEIVLDPFNVVPIVGFTKADDIIRFISRASRATGQTREALIQSPKFQQFIRGVSSEAGGRPPTGPLRGELRLPDIPKKPSAEVSGATEVTVGPMKLTLERPFSDIPEIVVDLERVSGRPAVSGLASVKRFLDEVRRLNPGDDLVVVLANERLRPALTRLGFRPEPGTELSMRLSAGAAFEVRPTGPLRGGRVFPEELTPVRVGEVLREFEPPNPHIAKADPGPPPKGPPRKPPAGPSPDDAEFGDIQRVAIRGEQPGETLMRRHQGAIDTAKVDAQADVVDGNKLLKEADLGKSFRGTRVPKTEGEFDELNSLLHNPSAVESGGRVVPDELRPIYDKLRAQTDFEQAARIDFDPNMALVEDYMFRGWKPPEGMFTGPARGQLGRNPSFRMPRTNASYDEMRALGFEPLFNNPVEQVRFSRLMGVKYREQSDLIEALKTRELALPHEGGPIPKGWRVPRVGSAFEGKPFAVVDNAGNPRTMFTRRFIVPDSLANRLENAYGVTPDLKTVTAFGKTAELSKVIDALVFTPKRAKLIASVFQHVDFATRSYVGAWAGFTNALRHGQPVAAVGHLAKWPDSALTMFRATTRPGFRQNLRRLRLDSTPLFKDRDLSMRMISEAGLSTQDVTILPGLDDIAREAAQGSKVKALVGQVADLERINRQGLFEGMYPAAILTDVKNNIAPMILRNHPDASNLELAGMIAKAANTKYSTVQAATSVVQNRFMRNFLTRFFFSMGEQEGLIRAFTGAIRGPNAAFWREHWVGAYVALIGAANVIHFASTGEPLPLSRYTPISKDKFGPLPFGYNRDFAAPDIPFTGRSGTELSIDLVGQLDTAFRLLDPASYLTSRTSVPVRAGLNQLQGKDFFGAPIDTVGPEGVVSRAAQLASDLFTPIGFGQSALQLARDNIEGAEGLIQPGEDRLGTAGTLVQGTGLNLRAETTPQLINRTRDDVMRELKFTGSYEELDPAPKEKVNVEVEKRIGNELEQRRDVAQIRGQVSAFGQQIQSVAAAGARVETESLAPAAKGVLSGDPQALEAYNKARTEFFTARRSVSESEAARLGLKPREREARTEQQGLVNAYYALEPQPGPNGFIDRDDMEVFFKAQDKILAEMSEETRNLIQSVSKTFTDPDVIRVEEIRLEAIDALKSVTALPKWQGLTLEEGEKLDDLVSRITADVQRFKAQATREGLDPDAVTFRSTAEWLEGRGEITELDALNAIAVSSGKAIREQGRIDLALENRRVLLTIFPNFLDSVLPVDVERQELTEQEIGQLEPVRVR